MEVAHWDGRPSPCRRLDGCCQRGWERRGPRRRTNRWGTARRAGDQGNGGEPKGPQVGRPMQKLVVAERPFSHRSLSTLLIVLASITENDELVAAVAGPGSVSKT